MVLRQHPIIAFSKPVVILVKIVRNLPTNRIPVILE
jgi:hypothetical protein